jgi:RNA polymerase sigma factor (sigma-70 family)
MSTSRDHILEHLIKHELANLRRFFSTKAPASDVNDLVQQTMLGFVERRDQIVGSERAYLMGIARFQLLRHYTSKWRTSAAPFDSAIHTARDVGPTFSSLLDSRTRLQQALHQLPLDHQIAFELRHGHELPLEDVAAAVGVSLATVKRYLSAAEAKLRALLGEAADHAGADYAKG